MALESKVFSLATTKYSPSAEWNKNDDFFRFTRGRFIVNEQEEMRKRHVTFDVTELGRIAAEAVGAERCVNVEKCSDGLYNKAMILSMEDGRQVIGKVPNPNAGLAHFTTASEVATMDFVGTSLKEKTTVT
ncbi:hypothetical protein LTR50_002049 [Elasticomyces elasticus]|nr:hypothetical protein LTR50_002049 [Elasticomyces elasticus]